ncbi:MAG: NAD(P)-dependent oxidoreductase [Planctomycetes bacterium]|nr:NAD(P)-dependent oxidoreductase [Planctomycetota bacterium]
MNILITGGTGFLGSHLARCLSDNNKIRIIASGTEGNYLSDEEAQKYNFAQCDIRNKASIGKVLSSDIDLVIHCAAVIRIQNDGRCPDDVVEINLNSTINLIEAMVDKGIKNIIFCSSMTVYGVRNRIPVKEDGLLEPIHFYGISKKWAEEAIKSYANKGMINALILRYPGLYGYPKDSGYIYNLSKKILKGEEVVVDSTGLKFWESLSVDDATSMTKEVLDKYDWGKQWEVINCGYGQEVDFVDTAFKIKKLTGSDSKIEVKEPLDYIKFYLDNSKIKGLLDDFDYDFEKKLNEFLQENKSWLAQ